MQNEAFAAARHTAVTGMRMPHWMMACTAVGTWVGLPAAVSAGLKLLLSKSRRTVSGLQWERDLPISFLF